ncbi:MAG: Glutaminase 1 [Actinomycetota bacterium]
MTENSDLDSLVTKMKSATAPIRQTLQGLHQKYLPLDAGEVARYIPELASADPNAFAIALAGVDGQIVDVGDSEHLFSIQSVSKPFVYGLALDTHGRDLVLSKVNVEPSGEAFNSIVLDEATNRPFNPFVNSGAIATTDLVPGADYTARVKSLLHLFANYAGRPVFVDNATFISERSTVHRNRAIAHLMLNFGMIQDRVDETLELYFQQCAILVNCRDLAVMAATLANGGVNPVTGVRAIEAKHVRDLLSLMFSCGMYDYAGSWGYLVGLPAKSSVSGAIMAVVPGQFGIAVFSPPLDERGNSVRGIAVCTELSERFGLHAFDAHSTGPTLADEFRPTRR